MRGHLLCLILIKKDMSKNYAIKWMTGLQAQHGCTAIGSGSAWLYSYRFRLSMAVQL